MGRKAISCKDVVLTLLVTFSARTSASIPNLAGWTLGFHDDFTGARGSKPNSTLWAIDEGTQYPSGPAHWGTGEIETYTNKKTNVELSGKGTLLITPRKSTNGSWTSGRIETKAANFKAAPGHKMRIQAAIAMPAVNTTNGLGYWPAFWALGASYRTNSTNWPGLGEWDILENVNGINFVHQGIHCGTASGGPCGEPSGLGGSDPCVGSKCQGNMHVYYVIVDRTVSPETLTFYVDGVPNYAISQKNLPASVWTAAVDRSSFLLLNVAIGGGYPDSLAGTSTPTNATISGVPMQVDYVGVWNK